MPSMASWPSWARTGIGRLPPYQVLLAAFGIAIGLVPGLPRVTVGAEFILAVFVPALVFEAALNLDLKALRSVALPVGLLATVGVLMMIGLVAALTHLFLRLEWGAAILLGAILCPTDPIAVVAVVRRSAAPPRLAAVLEGESLFNDGTGVAAFAAILASLAAGGFSISGSALRFLLLAGGGLLIGGLIGLLFAAMVSATRWPPLEVGLTLIAAYGSYLAATAAGASGVMAVVASGVAMARVGTWGVDTERSWAVIAIVLNAFLFTLIGVALPAAGVLRIAPAVAGGFVILLACRLLPVYSIGFQLPARWRFLIWWGGVRGALSVALALAATGSRGVAPSVPLLAYGVVTLSLLAQGSTIQPAARAAGLGGDSVTGDQSAPPPRPDAGS